MVIHAVYENGVFRPLDPIELPEGRRVDVIIPAAEQTSDADTPDESPQAKESRLLEEINRGVSETDWSRYHALIAKRQQEAIGNDDLSELTRLANQIEQLNAVRMERLAELARLRNTPLPQLMHELGLAAPAVL